MSRKAAAPSLLTSSDAVDQSVFSPMDGSHSASPRRPLIRESEERYIFYGNWSRSELIDQAAVLGIEFAPDISREGLIQLLESRNATIARRRFR
ncbi:MAG: hypothetical protein CSB44_08260 [Gammaproteobacteria bacterium]|nr:MAG: hypothetical protein CSB44_08260 [Gammaproteobacteria bacterium]